MSDKHLFFGMVVVAGVLGVAIGLQPDNLSNKIMIGAWSGLSYLLGVMSEKARKE